MTNNLTYRELKEQLDNLTENQLDADVTIYLGFVDEFCPVKSANVTSETNVLDENHFYLEV